jgi:hypothetical protein
MAGIAVATTVVRLVKVESMLMFRPFDEVDVPGVGGDADVVS